MAADGDSSGSNIPSVCTGEGGGVSIHIRCSNGSKFTVTITLDSTVGAFKALLAHNCDIPAEQQRLIYKGRILKDDQTLQTYGLQSDHTVHMVRGFAPASSTPPTNLNSEPSVTRGVGSTNIGGFGSPDLGASMFPGLGLNALGGAGGGGASSLFGSGLPEFEQLQQQMTQNPNMIRDIMDMPAMQSLLNNPDLMHTLAMSNPQMRDLIDRNPELAHVLNDPAILRQTFEAARNPELMREMMRNTDRAMSNIESSPEGFNMLRRMYENVQEPLLNATTMTGDDSVGNLFPARAGNQGGTQLRDSSNITSTNGSETNTGNNVPNSNPLPNPWSNPGGGTETGTTARSIPTADTRIPGIANLEGLGPQGLESIFGGVPDPAQMNQFMQNPAVSQMMQSLLSNPQYMSQLTSPENMQQILGLQQSLTSRLNQQPSSQESTQPNTATPGAPNNNGMEMLMNMLGALGTGGLTPQNQPNVPPEELYATQLAQLQEMGFFDTQENIRALRATMGNVHAAVERLLGNLGQ